MSNFCWRHVYDSFCNEHVLEGKEASSRNAYKDGVRSLLHEMPRVAAGAKGYAQRDFIDNLAY